MSQVTGTAANGDAFTGTLTVTKFISQGGKLAVVGTLNGALANAGTIDPTPFTAPVYQGDPTCQILYLHTGEITLNLLGLVVDIQPITITITAQSGGGNLLGNLLCAVANLLNRGGPAAGIAGLLNEILAALGL